MSTFAVQRFLLYRYLVTDVNCSIAFLPDDGCRRKLCNDRVIALNRNMCKLNYQTAVEIFHSERFGKQKSGGFFL